VKGANRYHTAIKRILSKTSDTSNQNHEATICFMSFPALHPNKNSFKNNQNNIFLKGFKKNHSIYNASPI
jgi:hypothetical protein